MYFEPINSFGVIRKPQIKIWHREDIAILLRYSLLNTIIFRGGISNCPNYRVWFFN